MDISDVLQRTADGYCYLGYALQLGSAELALLSALIAYRGYGLDTRALSEVSHVSESNVATVVASINRKVKAISGRSLVLSGRSTGYRLTEFP